MDARREKQSDERVARRVATTAANKRVRDALAVSAGVFWEPIRAVLVARRREIGWSQAELATALHVTPSQVTYLERNTRSFPTFPTLVAWADALGLKMNITFTEIEN